MWNKKQHTEDNSKLIEELHKRFAELSSEKMMSDEGMLIQNVMIALVQSNIKIEFFIDALELKETHIKSLEELYQKK